MFAQQGHFLFQPVLGNTGCLGSLWIVGILNSHEETGCTFGLGNVASRWLLMELWDLPECWFFCNSLELCDERKQFAASFKATFICISLQGSSSESPKP